MFTPRLTAPSTTDKLWISTRYGGYNQCIPIGGGPSVLPNCVGFAWGRFCEIMGATTCKLSTNNAGEWFGYTQDGYQRGQTPKLGAVVCWRRPGQAGHVAIVEQINPDNSIVTSESAYNSTRFYTQTLYPPGYTWSSQYILQGFIYNPAAPSTNASKIEGFVKEAKSHIGKSSKNLNFTKRDELSGAFVHYCAAKIPDILGSVIPDTENPSEFCAKGVDSGAGTFIPGPIYGKQPTPKVGDIVLVRKNETKFYSSKTDCDLLYIVVETEKTKVTSVGIDSSNSIRKYTCGTDSKYVVGYYRPKWEKLDNSTSQTIGYSSAGKLYDTENTSKDATVREVCYLDSKCQPSMSKGEVKLSVVNYTTLLAAFVDDLLVPSALSGNIGTDVNVDGITDSNARIVIEYLISKGLNAAAACGVAGNISHESGFRANAMGDYVGGVPTSFGICQWHYGRGEAMKTMAGAGWKNNLTGQLDYLWYELQNSYKYVLTTLLAVPNTDAGVRQAADTFVRKFEIPANLDSESQSRQATALEFWNKISIQMTTSASGSSTVVAGKPLSGTTIEIPSWIVQDGLSNIYTNYSYFFSRWAKSSYQRKVADLWAARGKKSNRNIATIDGYYLIATKPKFGKCGDKVSVILKDGTMFNAILADIKGAENGTGGAADYGHNSSGKINIIEWEGVGGAGSVYLPNPIDLTGWQGKGVAKIINGGSIL